MKLYRIMYKNDSGYLCHWNTVTSKSAAIKEANWLIEQRVYIDVFEKIDRIEIWPDRNLAKEIVDNFQATQAPKEKAIQKWGADVVEEAVSYYETDFGKEFWAQLNEEERHHYLVKARRNLTNQKTRSR